MPHNSSIARESFNDKGLRFGSKSGQGPAKGKEVFGLVLARRLYQNNGGAAEHAVDTCLFVRWTIRISDLGDSVGLAFGITHTRTLNFVNTPTTKVVVRAQFAEGALPIWNMLRRTPLTSIVALRRELAPCCI